MGELQAGLKVKVYRDPLRREDCEGTATLVRFIDEVDKSSWLEKWVVAFDGKDEECERNIRK